MLKSLEASSDKRKSSFLHLTVDSWPELKNFISNKKVIYNLYFDDSGKASIVICFEKDGIVYWEIEL